MRASLKAAAYAAGKEEWGRSGPQDSGQYNQFPEDTGTGFFQRELRNMEYRIWTILPRVVLRELSIGTWHYRSRSHPAELTTGYYNTRHHDGYQPIARMFGKHGVIFNFTCMEMNDGEQPEYANCSPQGLVQQVKIATRTTGIELAGENALERYDPAAYTQVLAASKANLGNTWSAFTYLRMNKKLFKPENWCHFVGFVKSMSESGRNTKLSGSDLSRTDLYVGFIMERSSQNKEAALV
ncbi:hypothetical protein Dimus_008454 [Dionaea muscipula]